MNAYQQHHSGIVSLNWPPKLRCLAQNVIAWLVSSRFPALAQYAIIAWLASLLMLPQLDPVCYHCLTLHLDTCFNHGLISKKYNLLDTLFVHSSLMMYPWYPHQRWHQWRTQKIGTDPWYDQLNSVASKRTACEWGRYATWTWSKTIATLLIYLLISPYNCLKNQPKKTTFSLEQSLIVFSITINNTSSFCKCL